MATNWYIRKVNKWLKKFDEAPNAEEKNDAFNQVIQLWGDSSYSEKKIITPFEIELKILERTKDYWRIAHQALVTEYFELAKSDTGIDLNTGSIASFDDTFSSIQNSLMRSKYKKAKLIEDFVRNNLNTGWSEPQEPEDLYDNLKSDEEYIDAFFKIDSVESEESFNKRNAWTIDRMIEENSKSYDYDPDQV